MVYNVFLFIACFLQVFAAVIAIRLTRVTKLNVSWMLICAALITMAIRSIISIVELFGFDLGFNPHSAYNWGGIFVSFCLAIGIFMIQKIFLFIRIANIKQRTYEKRLLRTMIQAEERERKRFATELHDGLGPILSSIKMNFSAISSDIKDKDVRQNLEQAITEAIISVREVSNNISPHILNNFGIDKAIRNFLGKISMPKGFNVDYSMGIGDKRYSSTKEIVIYRVFCELFNNTLRHAQATKVQFSIDEIDGMICMKYEDNGIGFDPEQMSDDKMGMGYFNIVSRVSSLKGTTVFRKGSAIDSNNISYQMLKNTTEDTQSVVDDKKGTFVEIKIPSDDIK